MQYMATSIFGINSTTNLRFYYLQHADIHMFFLDVCLQCTNKSMGYSIKSSNCLSFSIRGAVFFGKFLVAVHPNEALFGSNRAPTSIYLLPEEPLDIP